MACPSCGSDTPPGARFCPSCGHALVARGDERRVATVLFADLVGFTRLSESADPEQIKNIVDRTFERLAGDVVSYGGQVDKVIGDALVAIFGAPVAHEDDAERAVRAALRMQERLDQLNHAAHTELQMRIGINTGEVLVGAIRAGGDYTAMGDVVNTASRLQTIAAPGQVVVGPATYTATQRAVEYRPLGALTVKGREEPVDSWVAVGANAPPGLRRGRPETPLVGRDDELVVLRASLTTTVTRKRTHFMMIAGEAGVGKTRLAAELGREAMEVHEARVLTGHCIPYGETDAWYPIGAMIAAACGVDLDDDMELQQRAAARMVEQVIGSDADPAERARIAEGLVTLMGRDPHSTAVDPGRAREDAQRAGLTFFAALAADRPLVLILSDLHWADAELLEFLPRLLTRLAGLPAMLVATARAEFSDEWSPPPGRHNMVNVHLEPLDDTDTDELLAALLPATTADLRVALRERSGGNPFFVEELAAMAADADDGSPGELPATLHGLVAARLDRLPSAERNVLEDAAVIGMSGPITLVETLAASHGADVRACLAQLAGAGLLDLGDDEFAFRNELTREIAYGTLTKAERARRHGLLAKTIAQDGERTGRIEEVMDRLGYHFNLAASLLTELGSGEGLPPGMAREASSFLARAARLAEEREDWKAAEQYLNHALPLVDRDHAAERLELYVLRAKARAEQRDTPGARHDLGSAARLAAELDDDRARAACETILGDVQYKEGDLVAASATHDRAIEQWRTIGDQHGLAEALRFSGMAALFRGHMDKAGTEIEEALTLFRSAHDLRGEAWALQNLAWLAFLQGDYPTAEARLETSAATFAGIGDWGGVSWALGLLAWVRFTQGRMDEAYDLALRMEQEATELGNRWAGAMMKVLLANVALWKGHLAEAGERARSAIEVFRGLGDPWGELQAMGPLIVSCTLSGQQATALALLDEIETVGFHVLDATLDRMPGLVRVAIAIMTGTADALGLAERNLDLDGELFISDEQRMLMGLAQLQAGEVQAGLDSLSRAREVSIGAGSDAASAIAYAFALIASDRHADATAALEEVTPRLITYADRYRHAVARAFAASRRGDAAAADRALTEGFAVVEPTEAVLDQAIVRLAAAAIWRDQPRGDAANAEAFDLLAATGIRPVGWERLFDILAGTNSA